MRNLTLILLLVLAQEISAQDSFIDSIYYNIPVDEDVKHTLYQLGNNKKFKLISVDTIRDISSPPKTGDDVSFLAFEKSAIPNDASTVTYRKYRFFIEVDGHPKENCLQWRSDLLFAYRSKEKTEKEFDEIANFLSVRLRPKGETTMLNKNKVKIGYEFYLHAPNECPTLTVSVNTEAKLICISYY